MRIKSCDYCGAERRPDCPYCGKEAILKQHVETFKPDPILLSSFSLLCTLGIVAVLLFAPMVWLVNTAAVVLAPVAFGLALGASIVHIRSSSRVIKLFVPLTLAAIAPVWMVHTETAINVVFTVLLALTALCLAIASSQHPEPEKNAEPAHSLELKSNRMFLQVGLAFVSISCLLGLLYLRVFMPEYGEITWVNIVLSLLAFGFAFGGTGAVPREGLVVVKVFAAAALLSIVPLWWFSIGTTVSNVLLSIAFALTGLFLAATSSRHVHPQPKNSTKGEGL